MLKKWFSTTPKPKLLRFYNKINIMFSDTTTALIVPALVLGYFFYSWITYKDR
jgi:hypothetical protein